MSTRHFTRVAACLALIAAIPVLLESCRLLRPARVNSLRVSAGKKILIGPIENRGLEQDPHFIPNFTDLLDFFLTERGYETARLRVPPKTSEAATKVKRGDSTSDLLPDKLKQAAGENEIIKITESGGRRALSKEQRMEAVQKGEASYLLTGAVGRMESSNLLELQQSFVFYFRLFDKSGKAIAAFSYAAADESLGDADRLKKICAQLADEIARRITGG